MNNKNQNHIARVSKAPSKDAYISIELALQSAPNDGRPYTIYIDEGTYEERLNVEHNNVHLVGAGKNKTIISGAAVAGQLDRSGEIISTLNSRTLMVNAKDCSLKSLTIRNSFDYIGNAAKPADSPDKVTHTQAVALLLGNECDQCEISDVALEGYQDTLFVKGLRSYFHRCDISGCVDFIFGNGTAIFDQCRIIARDTSSIESSVGFVTAPSTQTDQEFGLTFFNCDLIKESPQIPQESYALGRPWHPTTLFSDGKYADPNAVGCTTFISCFLDDHIYGWDKMSGKDINGDQIWFSPDTDARFNLYQCRGDGAARSPFHLSEESASKYSIQTIFTGWIPKSLDGEK
ncbi:pectinesterase family protein [Marinomonas balearica]|uniref:Pectinesterase n=1 Tax=Marinomonas balearica TaxID=491947 RepID=A0A4V3CGR4_9GAMM|nr:pectinesterase family protein [Marinomonas balearica]TDO98702.1 pectinesterase [Marinomonas balearica]